MYSLVWKKIGVRRKLNDAVGGRVGKVEGWEGVHREEVRRGLIHGRRNSTTGL